MADTGIFGMGVAAEFGGFATDLVTKMEVIEEISAGNGSAGWISMIGAGAGSFTSMLPEEACDQIFADGPNAPLAGAAAPQGKAVSMEGGSRLTGRWQFASGCAHSRWMFAGHLVESEGSGAPPQRRMAFVPRDDVRIIDTWDTVGLRRTGSQDFEIDDLFVPTARTVAMGSASMQPDTLFRLPLPMIIAVEHTGQALGMARGALEAFIELTKSRMSHPTGAAFSVQPYVHDTVARAEARLGGTRLIAYEAAAEAWRRAEANDIPPLEARARYRLAMLHAALTAGEVIDALYYAAGGDAVCDSSPLGRFFRDWHTAPQHVFVSPSNFAHGGRVLLGIEHTPPGW